MTIGKVFVIVNRVRNSKNEMFYHLSDDVVNWDVNRDAHLLSASVRKTDRRVIK